MDKRHRKRILPRWMSDCWLSLQGSFSHGVFMCGSEVDFAVNGSAPHFRDVIIKISYQSESMMDDSKLNAALTCWYRMNVVDDVQPVDIYNCARTTNELLEQRSRKSLKSRDSLRIQSGPIEDYRHMIDRLMLLL